MDLTKGYWQIPVAHESRAKTTFVTLFGKYQCLTMPFGLMGASSTFQRMMDDLLRDINESAASYIDIIYCEGWHQHLEHIGAVLVKLRGANLRVKRRKCKPVVHKASCFSKKFAQKFT